MRFLKNNDLQNKIEKALSNYDYLDADKAKEAAYKISHIFLEGRFDGTFEDELEDAYDALGLELHTISSQETQPVTLMLSPNMPKEGIATKEVVVGVKNFKTVLHEIKQLWAQLYSGESLLHRQKKNITNLPAGGIIVQCMPPTQFSALLHCKEKEELVKGEINTGSWQTKKGERFNVQEDGIVQKREGTEKQVDEALLSQLSKYTRRIRGSLGKDVQLLLAVHKGRTQVLCVEAYNSVGTQPTTPRPLTTNVSGESVAQLHKSLGVSVVQAWAVITDLVQNTYTCKSFEEYQDALQKGRYAYATEAGRVGTLARRASQGSGVGVDEAFFAIKTALKFFDANKK